MRNVLITQLSPLPNNKSVTRYRVALHDCDIDYIEAVQTNESIIKCMSHLCDVKSSGGLDLIIVLGTKRTNEFRNQLFENATSFEYYQQVVNDCGFVPKYVNVNIDDVGITEAFNIICSEIKEEDVVYIDSAGGQRTVSNLVQIVTKMLKYLDILNPYTLYASRQEGQEATIESTANFSRLLSLADAFNEFMTTGKADQLSAYFDGQNTSLFVKNLLSAMSEFSNNIRMGTVENLDKTIEKLSNAIDQCILNIDKLGDIDTVILYRFLPTIKQKLLADNTKEVDYLKIIQWCLDNTLIQQALTLYVEKIPAILIQRGIVHYHGDISTAKQAHAEARTKSPILPASWEAYAIYTEMLGYSSLTSKSLPISSDPDVVELKMSLTLGCRAVRPNVIKLIRCIDAFKQKLRYYKPKNKHEEAISRFLEKNATIKSWSGLKSMIANQEKTMYGLLHPEIASNAHAEAKLGSKSIETFQTKLDSIRSFLTNGSLCKPFSTDLDIQKVAKILISYVYAKSIRNKINHASSEANLDNSQKEYISEFGFDCSKDDLSTILRNLQSAVNILKESENH